MLPAIWFIFSRRECDLAARHLDMHGVQLTSAEGARRGGGRGGGLGGGLGPGVRLLARCGRKAGR